MEEWNFAVQHENAFADTSPTLTQVLCDIKKWSNENKDHLVVTIHVDLKMGCCHGESTLFPEKLDFIFQKV